MNQPKAENIDKATKSIAESYRSDDRTQRVGQTALPSRDRIVEIVDLVQQLLFPGYFGEKKLNWKNVRYCVGNLLIKIKEILTDQIWHCLCSERHCDGCPEPEKCQAESGDLADKFIQRVPKVRRMLALDAQAAYDGDPAAKGIDEVIYCYPGFYAIMVYRIAHELAELGVPLMPRIMTEHAHSATGTDIHPGATIGKSFFIDHATGVVIGETTRIGDNVKIYQGVTLGAKSFPKDERGRLIKGLRRHPLIEDNVTIYPNATILGGQTVIGKGATVGGNAYVTASIGPGSVVKQPDMRLKVVNRKRRGGK